MFIRSLLAAAAVILVPIAVVGAAEPSGGNSADATKKTCEVNVPTGSRLGGVRRCRTRAEREAARAESQRVVDRIQSQKNFTEAMSGMGAGRACNASPIGC